MGKSNITIVVVVVVLMVLVIVSTIVTHKECEDSGGQMVGTGEYQTIFVQSGNVMIPIQDEIETCEK